MADLNAIKEMQQARLRAKLKEMAGKGLANLVIVLITLYAFNYSYGQYGFERTLIALLALILIALNGLKRG